MPQFLVRGPGEIAVDLARPQAHAAPAQHLSRLA